MLVFTFLIASTPVRYSQTNRIQPDSAVSWTVHWTSGLHDRSLSSQAARPEGDSRATYVGMVPYSWRMWRSFQCNDQRQ